jgi:hypothetical protein
MEISLKILLLTYRRVGCGQSALFVFATQWIIGYRLEMFEVTHNHKHLMLGIDSFEPFTLIFGSLPVATGHLTNFLISFFGLLFGFV